MCEYDSYLQTKLRKCVPSKKFESQDTWKLLFKAGTFGVYCVIKSIWRVKSCTCCTQVHQAYFEIIVWNKYSQWIIKKLNTVLYQTKCTTSEQSGGRGARQNDTDFKQRYPVNKLITALYEKGKRFRLDTFISFFVPSIHAVDNAITNITWTNAMNGRLATSLVF